MSLKAVVPVGIAAAAGTALAGEKLRERLAGHG
jgi:hypothetical protein